MKTNKPTITQYILSNPGAKISEVMRATGAKRDSVSTVFTILRRAYRDAPVNTAGLRVPEGLPPFTEEMFEQLTYKRPSVRLKHRKLRVVVGKKKEKKPIDMTAQPVKMPEEPPRKTRVEAIDLIESQGLGFHLGMVIEYICMASRLGTNDGMRSLELAKVYLDRAIAKNVEPNTSR